MLLVNYICQYCSDCTAILPNYIMFPAENVFFHYILEVWLNALLQYCILSRRWIKLRHDCLLFCLWYCTCHPLNFQPSNQQAGCVEINCISKLAVFPISNFKGCCIRHLDKLQNGYRMTTEAFKNILYYLVMSWTESCVFRLLRRPMDCRIRGGGRRREELVWPDLKWISV